MKSPTPEQLADPAVRRGRGGKQREPPHCRAITVDREKSRFLRVDRGRSRLPRTHTNAGFFQPSWSISASARGLASVFSTTLLRSAELSPGARRTFST